MLSHRDLPTDVKQGIIALLADPDRSPERMLHLAEVLQVAVTYEWVKGIAADYDRNERRSRETTEAMYVVYDAPIEGERERVVEVDAAGVEIIETVLPARHKVR